MPIRALTHLRPILRLPNSHQSSPEHFSSNPSLLHHLSSGKNGESSVSVGGQHAASSGSSGSNGAGRAGWGNNGAGAGGGGYTGHGRAFLSLPHTGLVDPSSSISTSSSDERQRKSSQRSALLLKHRLSRRTEIVNLDEGVGRSVHRQIESRAASTTRVGLIDIESSSPAVQLLVEDAEDDSNSRHTITFPSERPPPTPRQPHSPLPPTSRVSSPVPSRPSTPSRRGSRQGGGGLHRSTSSLDIWNVALPRQLSLRSMSTATEAATEPEVGLGLVMDSAPETLEGPQAVSSSQRPPQRILMDLAGQDARPTTTRMFVRRHSTASMTVTPPSSDGFDPSLMTTETSSGDLPSEQNTQMRRNFIAALENPANDLRRLNELIAYYRSPRTINPADSASPELAQSLPLPERYTTRLYNHCMQQLINTRAPGQSISTMVEIYNEMLQRDCRPDRLTYNLLIQAFSSREQDVWRAASKWEEQKRWSKWWDSVFEKEHDDARDERQDLVIEGYKAEANLANAFRLTKALQLVTPQNGQFVSGKLFLLGEQTDRDLLTACELGQVASGDLQYVKDLYMDRVRAHEIIYYRTSKLFAILSRAGDVQGVKDLWSVFLEEDARLWSDEQPDARHKDNALRFQRFPTFARAATAFFEINEIDMGMDVLKTFVNLIEAGEFGDITTYSGPLVTPLKTLIQKGRVEEMWFIHDRLLKAYAPHVKASEKPAPLFVTAYSELSDALAERGEWEVALNLISPFLEKVQDQDSDAPSPPAAADNQYIWKKQGKQFVEVIHRTRLYAAILKAARDKLETDPSSVPNILAPLSAVARSPRRLPHNDDLVKLHLSIVARLGLYDQIPALVLNFEPSNTSVDPQLAEVITDVSKTLLRSESVSFALMLRSLRLLQQLTRAVLTPEDAAIVSTKYLDARGKVSTASDLGIRPQLWLDLANDLLMYPADEPEVDDALIQLMGDFKTVFGASEELLQTAVSHSTCRRMVPRLIHRFGRERGTELIEQGYGEARGEDLVQIYETTQASAQSPFTGESETVEGAAREDGASVASDGNLPFGAVGGQFIVPPPPAYIASVPPLSNTAQSRNYPPRHNIGLVKRLATQMNSAIKNRTPIPALQLFKEVSNNFDRHYQVPGITELSRLIDALSRVETDHRRPEQQSLPLDLYIQQLYALSQTLLPFSPSPERDWLDLENAMILASCNLGHLEQAGHHRARIIQAGCVPSADAYATMIASAKDTTDDAVVATQLWSECQALGVRPNLYLYNTIISKLSKARKAEGALELFAAMKSSGIRPSSVTYGAVINACCRVGDGQSAATLFNEMTSQPNFRPRVPPFNTMMQFHLTTQPNREAVLHYFNALIRSGISPSAHSYKLLLDAYAVLPPVDLPSFERVFNELIADPNVPVQGTHWASAITANGIYASDPERALELFNSISTHPTASVDLRTEPVVWEAILNVLSQRSSIDQMEQVHGQMTQSGARATAYVLNVLISGYARGGKIDTSREIFNAMGDSLSGVAAPNNHPQLLTSSGHAKPNTITEDPTAVVFREPSTYEAMIKAELMFGSRENAEEVLRMMEGRRYPVAVYMRAQNLILDHEVNPTPAAATATATAQTGATGAAGAAGAAGSAAATSTAGGDVPEGGFVPPQNIFRPIDLEEGSTRDLGYANADSSVATSGSGSDSGESASKADSTADSTPASETSSPPTSEADVASASSAMGQK